MQNLILSRRFALVFLAFFAVATYGRPPDLDWLIVPGERVGPITAETSEASLEALFGAGHVRRADVYIGEGSTTQGTAIYPDDTERRIEIIWSDVARTVPKEIRLTGNSSKWHTAEGISLGSTLKDIERLNRFPFRLMGFAWDYAGTIVDCGRGRLAALRCSGDSQRSPTGRLTIVRLAPEDPTRVLGLPDTTR